MIAVSYYDYRILTSLEFYGRTRIFVHHQQCVKKQNQEFNQCSIIEKNELLEKYWEKEIEPIRGGYLSPIGEHRVVPMNTNTDCVKLVI